MLKLASLSQIEKSDVIYQNSCFSVGVSISTKSRDEQLFRKMAKKRKVYTIYMRVVRYQKLFQFHRIQYQASLESFVTDFITYFSGLFLNVSVYFGFS